MFSHVKNWLRHLRPSPDWRPLTRTARQERAYAEWLETTDYEPWLRAWFKAYHYRKAGLPAQWRVELLRAADHAGVVLYYDERIGAESFTHLFQLLKDRVLALGYNLALSDERCGKCAQYTQHLARHTLRPQPADTACRKYCNQRYGQVTVDLVRIDFAPGFIRLVAKPLPGEVFSAAKPFDELLKAVLEPACSD